jgi:hypothetical protein
MTEEAAPADDDDEYEDHPADETAPGLGVTALASGVSTAGPQGLVDRPP